MTPRTIQRPVRLAAIAAAMLAASASVAGAFQAHFCFDYDRSTRTLTVEARNGCVSSSYRFDGHDIAFDVQNNRALISQSGRWNYTPPTNGIALADCGGARALTFTVTDVAPRRYTFISGNQRLGVLDLIKQTKRVCLTTIRHDRLRPDVLDQSDEHARILGGRAGGQMPTADSVLALLTPYLKGHPESAEGAPSMTMSLKPAGDGQRLDAVIEQHGFLDDSVSGMRIIAHVVRRDGRWALTGVWRSSMCGRGDKAGQWTGGRCP